METRQRIIDAAVDLFVERGGYSMVGLQAIANRAKVTTGAFYYHFESKEALASAIIAQTWPKLWEVVARHASTPGLESVTAMTFDLTDLLKRDRGAWMGHHFALVFSQVSEPARRTDAEGSQSFFETVAAMIDQDDIRDDITRDDMATQVSMNLFGCHILADRLQDSVAARMTRSWLTLLRGTAPADRLPHFEEFALSTAAQYG